MSSQKNIPDVKANNQIATKHVIKRASSTQPPLDAGMKSRILKLMKDSTSSLNMEEILKGQKTSSTHSFSLRILEDKTFTEGKVEGYVKVHYGFTLHASASK